VNAPVFVCSKQRPKAPLFQLLAEVGFRALVFVEPQDRDLYDAPTYDVAVLERNDAGLAFARQAALEHARAVGLDWFWLLDDDISAFWRTDPLHHRNMKVTADYALERAERWADSHDGRLGLVALEYAQYAWNARRGGVTWCSYCDCCVLVNTDTPANYRLSLPLKVDRDFTLQTIAHGYDSARLRDLSFTVPRNGSNAGGLHDRYAQGIERTASARMAELWPGVCTPYVKSNGRPDIKIAWRDVRQMAVSS